MPFLNGGNEEWLQQAVNSFGDTPVLVLRNDGEMAEAMNLGLQKAETEFVLPFGADDIALPGFIDELLLSSWNADVVYPTMKLVSEDLKTYLGEFAPDPFCGNRLQEMNFVSGAAMVRREKALEVGGWRQLKGLEDWDLWVRIFRAGGRFKPAPNAEMAYRQVAGSRNKIKEGQAGQDFIGKLRREIIGDPDPIPDIQATFYHHATPATTYLRCQLPARYLPGISRPNPMVAFTDEGAIFPEHYGDTAIFQFAANKVIAALIEHMRIAGIRTLIEVDDNYLINPGNRILKRQQWAVKIGDAVNTRDGHRLLAGKVDGIIVTTPHLRDEYLKVNPNVYVCPNSVDPIDWPEPEKPDDGILRIAWFASKSHETDVPLVREAFAWASQQKDVEVYMAGLNPMDSHSDAIRLRWRNIKFGYLPWFDDLDAYRQSFRHFDIGVAPVYPTPMGLGRSDVKALEMAMGLQCPILSDVAPYDPWTDGENCLKAKDSQGFLKIFKHLVKHPDEAKQLAQAARDYTLSERTTEAQIDCWRDACHVSTPASLAR